MVGRADLGITTKYQTADKKRAEHSVATRELIAGIGKPLIANRVKLNGTLGCEFNPSRGGNSREIQAVGLS